MVVSGAGPTGTIVNINTDDFVIVNPGPHEQTYYTTIIIVFTTTVSFSVGQTLTVTGNSFAPYNWSFYILSVSGNTVVCSCSLTSSATGTGGSASASGGSTITRSGNVVSVLTATPHGLQVGYQAQITNVPATQVATISSIVIDNTSSPGIATVTTAAAHGLVPQNQINISGVSGTAIGGAIVSATRRAQIVTVVTTSAHGLQIGSQVLIAGTADATYIGQFPVLDVPSTTSFTYYQFDTDSTTTGGTVTAVWPVANSDPALNYFTVQTAPTPTTFTMGFSYPNGTWTGGTITFGWNGIFYVATVPSTTQFTYQQYGPNATSSTVGTVTPYGQLAPGKHLCRVSFLTRQGQQTKPSPYTSFEANGGQYPSLTNIAIGPSNIAARILEFTGAQGSFFFYIPVPAQVSGQVVSTATQINDNTTTAAIVDFGDPTLYTGVATSAPTYSTAQQIVIDGALGFLFHKQRLLAFGQRNTVNNFLNMGFDGGSLPSAPTVPTGWTYLSNFGSGALSVVTSPPGFGWKMICDGGVATACGYIKQSAYADSFGAPILSENTVYAYRLKISYAGSPNGIVAVNLKDSNGLIASASFSLASAVSGTFRQVTFSAPTRASVDPSTYIEIYFTNAPNGYYAIIDEGQIFPILNPYIDNLCNGSYLSAPDQFNGLTGQFGPPDDTHKIMDGAVIRNTLYLITQDPEGRLHEVLAKDTEPVGWEVAEVDSVCGALSAFCLTKSQADSRSASGGEEWFAWASQSGPRIFGGSTAHKIGQEIQPAWFDQQNNQTFPQVNMAAALTTWVLNDPSSRTIYFGLPLLPISGTGGATAPNIIYPVNYRQLDSAEAIAGSPPFHPSLGGRLIATDNSRKWTRWNMKINGASLMYRSPGVLSVVLFGGNGQEYGSAAGFGNVYTLNGSKNTDDDYGLIQPYYVTFFMPSDDQSQALQLDAGRKQVAYMSANLGGLGKMTITVLCNNLQNPWSLTGVRTLMAQPNFDIEWSGGSAQGQRMAFKFASSPIAGTDNDFQLSKVAVWFRAARLRVRGSAQ
jgi:hypothetical protein